jgi:hypothetical protein
MTEEDKPIVAAADEYESLTADKFDAATEVFKKDGDAYNKVEKPAAFEDGLYEKKAGGDPAGGEGGGEGGDTTASTDTDEVNSGGGDIDQFVDVLLKDAVQLKPGLTADHIIAGAQRMNGSVGGRRRSKRRQPKRSAKKSQKGGRRSSKNRRKHSRRLKH